VRNHGPWILGLGRVMPGITFRVIDGRACRAYNEECEGRAAPFLAGGSMASALQWYEGLPVSEVQVGDTLLRYRKAGSGPPVVMVHGWPLHGATWRYLMRDLAGEYACYAVDLPGAGQSPRKPGLGDLFSQGGRLVTEFAEALALRHYALVGFDSGGAIARLAAARDPGRVGAIVLGNTEIPGHVPPMVRALQRAAHIPGFETSFRLLLRSRAYCRSRYGFGGCFVDRSLIDGEFRQAFIEPLIQDAGGAMETLRSGDLDGLTDRLRRAHQHLSMPVHLVWGARDPFFPVRLLPDLTAELPDAAEPVIVDQARLCVHEEAPETFLRVTRDALAEARVLPGAPARA
jgi:pimeloyl-ACP methyl ester carboxylesterase